MRCENPSRSLQGDIPRRRGADRALGLVGKGHVWVYREEDLGRATGMEGEVYKKKRKK
jgi:hypothetical protein